MPNEAPANFDEASELCVVVGTGHVAHELTGNFTVRHRGAGSRLKWTGEGQPRGDTGPFDALPELACLGYIEGFRAAEAGRDVVEAEGRLRREWCNACRLQDDNDYSAITRRDP